MGVRERERECVRLRVRVRVREMYIAHTHTHTGHILLILRRVLVILSSPSPLIRYVASLFFFADSDLKQTVTKSARSRQVTANYISGQPLLL